jgi:hypothetical protein
MEWSGLRIFCGGGNATGDSALLYFALSRGVAQPGSVLAWGARGRVFESLRPDQLHQRVAAMRPFFILPT